MLLKGADKMAKNDQKCWSQTGFEPGQGPSRNKKSENFWSKALPLSHKGIILDGDKSKKEFPISKMLLLNIGHELTYYNGCQNAKNGQIL